MIKLKRGDSFLLSLTVSVGGEIQDLTNWTISSQVRDDGAHVADLQVEMGDPTSGVYSLSADTSNWPLGQLEFDIRYVTDAGQICTTDTVKLQMIQGQTRGG